MVSDAAMRPPFVADRAACQRQDDGGAGPTPRPNVAMKERELQQAVQEAAALFGWLYYHTYDSRRSNPGFPDLVLARNGTILFVELKSQTGKVSPEQQTWLDAVGGIVWRPSDWLDGTITETLR